MNPHRENYKGRDIDIAADGTLTVNSKRIEYEFDHAQNKWSSRYLPYSQYDSLVDLARAVAGDTEEFKNAAE